MGAHHTDTDLGAENVASKPDTAFTRRPSVVYRSTSSRPNRVPVVGSRLDSNASNASTSTRPDRPSPAACRPDHTPGTSPGTAVRYCDWYDAVADAHDACRVVIRSVGPPPASAHSWASVWADMGLANNTAD